MPAQREAGRPKRAEAVTDVRAEAEVRSHSARRCAARAEAVHQVQQLERAERLGEEEVRARARERFGRLIAEVARLSGAGPAHVVPFFGQGMLLNVVAALDLPDLADPEGWVRRGWFADEHRTA